MAQTRRVRTGPSSYLNLDEQDYKAWKQAGNREWSESPADEQDMEEAEAATDAATEDAPDEGSGGSVKVSRRKTAAKKAGS